MAKYALGCWATFVRCHKWAKPYRMSTYHDFCQFGDAIIDWVKYPCHLLIYGGDADKRQHFMAMLIRELFIVRHFHSDYVRYFDRVSVHDQLILTKSPNFIKSGILFCGEYRDAYRPDVCKLLYDEWSRLLQFRLAKNMTTILSTNLVGNEIFTICGPQNVDKLKMFKTVDVGAVDISPFKAAEHGGVEVKSQGDQNESSH